MNRLETHGPGGLSSWPNLAICPARHGALSCLPNLPPYVRCALSKQLKSIATVVERCRHVTSGKSNRARLDFDPVTTLTTISGTYEVLMQPYNLDL